MIVSSVKLVKLSVLGNIYVYFSYSNNHFDVRFPSYPCFHCLFLELCWIQSSLIQLLHIMTDEALGISMHGGNHSGAPYSYLLSAGAERTYEALADMKRSVR